ncbi:hypothetical protein HD597_000002 [Nonomuraea thailandensis]|uniref:Uncharacterized protein n=1 Tax=Nonomuraea thailandensis TaxID=1188745 RepID=A0A9X2G5H4_9ACTN|nr:hypothetical protein [Nonomuraea thailandensis]MCP2352982.1 hypothetical protein [Nonomuraea thailandensis]
MRVRHHASFGKDLTECFHDDGEVTGCSHEEEDVQSQHHHRLITVEHGRDVQITKDLRQVSYVGLDHRGGLIHVQQCPPVDGDHGVVIDVRDARPEGLAHRDLVDVPASR